MKEKDYTNSLSDNSTESQVFKENLQLKDFICDKDITIKELEIKNKSLQLELDQLKLEVEILKNLQQENLNIKNKVKNYTSQFDNSNYYSNNPSKQLIFDNVDNYTEDKNNDNNLDCCHGNSSFKQMSSIKINITKQNIIENDKKHIRYNSINKIRSCKTSNYLNIDKTQESDNCLNTNGKLQYGTKLVLNEILSSQVFDLETPNRKSFLQEFSMTKNNTTENEIDKFNKNEVFYSNKSKKNSFSLVRSNFPFKKFQNNNFKINIEEINKDYAEGASLVNFSKEDQFSSKKINKSVIVSPESLHNSELKKLYSHFKLENLTIQVSRIFNYKLLYKN